MLERKNLTSREGRRYIESIKSVRAGSGLRIAEYGKGVLIYFWACSASPSVPLTARRGAALTDRDSTRAIFVSAHQICKEKVMFKRPPFAQRKRHKSLIPKIQKLEEDLDNYSLALKGIANLLLLVSPNHSLADPGNIGFLLNMIIEKMEQACDPVFDEILGREE